MGTFRTHPRIDAGIADLGERQHAVLSLDQLRELGLTAAAARKRKGVRRLHRRFRGVYSLVPRRLLTRKGHFMAAVLACGPGAVLSHRSAAALLGLRETAAARIDVTVPGRGKRRHAGVLVHRSTTLTPSDITVVDGIRCTTVARTLFDLADAVARRPVERAYDQADAMQVLDLGAIEDQLARNSTRRAARVTRAILDEHYIGSTLTESELEEAMLLVSRAIGLSRPEVQRWLNLHDGGGMIRPDFMWRAQRLIVEVDSAKYHRTRQRFEADRLRDQRAMVAGWRVIRTTHRQIKQRPGELRATISHLLAQDAMAKLPRMTDDENLFGEEHVRVYRETGGERGYNWRKGTTILLLTTKGRKSGEERTTPLIHRVDGDRWVIVASKGGAPDHPGWFKNLEKEPEAEIQVKDEVIPVRASVAEGDERERLWSEMVEAWPDYEDYKKKTDREIPVVILSRR